ncbi:unnamed protein product [Calypogeia fissa]
MPITSLYQEDAYKVWEIQTLGMVRDARKLLQAVAKQVHPIMHKRKWIVPPLSDNPNLLGLKTNWEQQIEIRLRMHPNDPQLFDFEETLETMLHELSHIQCAGMMPPLISSMKN